MNSFISYGYGSYDSTPPSRDTHVRCVNTSMTLMNTSLTRMNEYGYDSYDLYAYEACHTCAKCEYEYDSYERIRV